MAKKSKFCSLVCNFQTKERDVGADSSVQESCMNIISLLCLQPQQVNSVLGDIGKW